MASSSASTVSVIGGTWTDDRFIGLCIGSDLPHSGMHDVMGPRRGVCGHQDSIPHTVFLITCLSWPRGNAEKRKPIYDSIVHHHPVREYAIILSEFAPETAGMCVQAGRRAHFRYCYFCRSRLWYRLFMNTGGAPYTGHSTRCMSSVLGIR